MPTHFDRSAVQLFFENRVGCSNPEDFSAFLHLLTSLSLSLEDANTLSSKVSSDINGQFERAMLTLLQASVDAQQSNYLWASVKLYYAVFYAIRVELHLNGLSMIRCNQVFTSSGRWGTSVTRFNNKKEKGDHGIAIALITRHLKSQDIMQGAQIEGTNVYLWMKNLREIVQYKMRRPPELVDYEPFFPASQMDFKDQVSIFLADSDPYYCFDPDFAALAIPIKRLQLTAKHVKATSVPLSADFRNSAFNLADKTPAGKLLKPLLW